MSTNVEIKLKLTDQATSGLKAAAKEAERASASISTNQIQANTRTASSFSKLNYEMQAGIEKTARAREILGVRAEYKVQQEIRATQQAYKQLALSGEASSRELSRAYEAQIQKIKSLKNEMGELTRMQKLTNGATVVGGVAAGAAVTKSVLANPVRSYADLESAQADLQIALMTKGGKVSAAYDTILKQATDLGNQLPGATKDFVAAATALKQQGMTDSAITGGGLKAAAQFGVLTDMNQYESATTVAKIREAYGLGGNELPEAANLMQKGRFAFGIAPQDYLAVAAYAAPTYNTLGLTGIENTKDMIAAQGLAANKGLENTSFGTNFSMMLMRTSQLDTRMNGRSQEAKEVKAMLDEHHINMSFFTKAGKFAGAQNMVKELEKLKPLSDQDRLRILTKMFGVEAARPASILVDAGLKGFMDARNKLDEQANMGERMATKTSTLKSKQEAASGSWENTKATVAKPLGEVTKKILDGTTTALAKVQPTLEKHPGLGTGALLATGLGLGIPAGLAATQGLKAVLGTGAGVRAIAAIPGVTQVAKMMTKVPLVPKGAGVFGLAAGVGGAVLSSVAGENSTAARYGSAALSGAGLGATVGSVVPGVGTVVGAGIGGVLGLLAQYLNSPANKEPAKVDSKLTVGLAPGLVITNQSTTSTNNVKSVVQVGNLNGNLWGIP